MTCVPDIMIAEAKRLCREHFGQRERCIEPEDMGQWLDDVAEDHWHSFVEQARAVLKRDGIECLPPQRRAGDAA